MAKSKKKKRKVQQLNSQPQGPSGTSPKASVPNRIGRRVGGFNRANALEWIRSILIAVFLALLIRWPLIEPFKIPSGSMKPTFQDGDRIFVNKFIYGVRFPFNGMRLPFTRTSTWYSGRRIWYGSEPQRWDIIVFKSVEPEAEHNTLVKRIVGLPGERVHIEDGTIFINAKPLDVPDSLAPIYYTSPLGRSSMMRYGIYPEDEFSLVPEGHYLVLGDNSGQSRDGRYFGWLPNHHILGRVSSIWWPLSRWRDLTGFSNTVWWNTLLAVLALMLVVRLFFGRSWRVYEGVSGPRVSQGVSPDGISQGDHLVINRIALGLPIPLTRKRFFKGRDPKRGELVLFHGPPDSPEAHEALIARVAGFPGERVFLDDGTLRVNDVPLNKPSSLANIRFSSDGDTGPYGRSKGRDYSLVPEDHFFVLSEDPAASPDSRSLGWIHRRDLVGTVVSVWWPLTRLRRIRP